MDWGRPEKFSDGEGATQKSSNPSGYSITYTKNKTGTASYCASRGDVVFARFYLEEGASRDLMQAAARSMRVACGMHFDGGGSNTNGRRRSGGS